MAETANIAKMAEKLSNELFAEFLWKPIGPTNWNWPCSEKRHQRKTHPSDVVFYYDNPYAPIRTYINCDLKSYGRSSISGGAIRNAVENLGQSLICAETSKEWQNKYIHDHTSATICGLLFVYNHDGAYDKGFGELLAQIDIKELEIPRSSKLVVLGPSDIFWLDNVRTEIVQMRGMGALPAREDCRFHYPSLVRKKNVQPDNSRAATLEMLTGPWITLSYSDQSTRKDGFVVFYRGRGETTEEFLYLLDYLQNYQMDSSHVDIHVKILDSDGSAQAMFGKAVDQYLDEFKGGPDWKQKLERIAFNQMSHVKIRFSELEIGMERE